LSVRCRREHKTVNLVFKLQYAKRFSTLLALSLLFSTPKAAFFDAVVDETVSVARPAAASTGRKRVFGARLQQVSAFTVRQSRSYCAVRCNIGAESMAAMGVIAPTACGGDAPYIFVSTDV